MNWNPPNYGIWVQKTTVGPARPKPGRFCRSPASGVFAQRGCFARDGERVPCRTSVPVLTLRKMASPARSPAAVDGHPFQTSEAGRAAVYGQPSADSCTHTHTPNACFISEAWVAPSLARLARNSPMSAGDKRKRGNAPERAQGFPRLISRFPPLRCSLFTSPVSPALHSSRVRQKPEFFFK